MDYVRAALLALAAMAAPHGLRQPAVVDAAELHAGFRLLYELQPVNARAAFAARRAAHPQDPVASAAEAASYLFEECYRQGVLTSAYFLDDKRFLGEVAIAADPHLRDAFFARAHRTRRWEWTDTRGRSR